MKKALLLLCVISIIFACSNDTHEDEIEDDGLNVFIEIKDADFKKYCDQFDHNNDGVLTRNEAAKVKEIKLPYPSYGETTIRDLRGIEYFINITTLNVTSNPVTELNISKNIKLKKLICHSAGLTSLDLSHNVELEYLECHNSGQPISRNNIQTLDLSKNINLLELNCSSNKMISLDVSGCKKLKKILCAHNKIKKIDITNNLELETLACYNGELTEIDTSQNVNLDFLNLMNNNLSALDISNNNKLHYLQAGGNENLKTIYVWVGFDTSNPENTVKQIRYDSFTKFVIKW